MTYPWLILSIHADYAGNDVFLKKKIYRTEKKNEMLFFLTL